MDPNRVLFDFDFKLRLADARVEAVLAGGDVVLPAVPGTGDDTAGDGSFGDRAALMCTQAVESVEVAVEIEQRDDATSDREFSTGARRYVDDGREFVPIGHELRFVLIFVQRLPGLFIEPSFDQPERTSVRFFSNRG